MLCRRGGTRGLDFDLRGRQARCTAGRSRRSRVLLHQSRRTSAARPDGARAVSADRRARHCNWQAAKLCRRRAGRGTQRVDQAQATDR